MSINGSLNRKLRFALVGGGRGSFIGRVHSIAAQLDNRAVLVAGALSSDPVRSRESAEDYGIDPSRAYGSYKEMIEKELALPESERIDFVSIATPNHTHYEIAAASVDAGFNVVCDKPLTLDLAQAEALAKKVAEKRVVFGVTHNYTGYPLVRQARQMVQNGELGEIRAIRSNYIQGWLCDRLELDDHKQAAWRVDPKRSGVAGAFGDIGTHAYNLGRYISGLLPDKVSGHLKAFVEGRTLDDYGTVVIRMENGALMNVTASQISHGRENDLRIEIDGTKASLEWRQESPNEMIVRANGEPQKVYTRDPNHPLANELHKVSCRLPSGHPEAFFEAFANVYVLVMDDIVRRIEGQSFETRDTVYPNVHDGTEGMYFIEQCVASSKQDGAWLPLRHESARS